MTKKIETIADLQPDPSNANQGSVRGHSIIERSVRQRGAGRSGLAAADGTMIAGSQTLQKMAELGIPIRPIHTTGEEWVVVIRDDIEPGSEEAQLLAIEDNRATEVGLVWEPDILAGIAESGVDLSGLFTADEWADVSMPALVDAEPDEPVIIDETKPTRCQPGDVWRIGRHTVACLDSTDRANMERLIAGRTVGMVVADPPYGIDIVSVTGFVGGGAEYHQTDSGIQRRPNGRTSERLGTVGGSKPFGSAPRRDHVVTANSPGDNMIAAGRYAPVAGDDGPETAMTAVALALDLVPDATHFWWGANNYAHILPPSTCWIVWDKQNTGNFADAELAWSNHKSAVRIFQHMWNGLMKESERGTARVHPTQKPIALFAWLYGKYGKEDDTIFDPFLGSGPSLKAAEPSGRTVIGCELSPAYIDHIIDWGEAHGLEASRVDD